MSRKLLISDANIIIDIIAGRLVEPMFSLDYDFGVPDVLYAEELEQNHSEILQAGLQLFELTEQSINNANRLYQANKVLKVSIMDCMGLSLAQQEACTLLTGDAGLKQLATNEGTAVKGTLWLVKQMLEAGLIDVAKADSAYQSMLADGSRLPVREITRQLNYYRTE